MCRKGYKRVGGVGFWLWYPFINEKNTSKYKTDFFIKVILILFVNIKENRKKTIISFFLVNSIFSVTSYYSEIVVNSVGFNYRWIITEFLDQQIWLINFRLNFKIEKNFIKNSFKKVNWFAEFNSINCFLIDWIIKVT